VRHFDLYFLCDSQHITMTTLSEGCPCPVCGNRFSVSEIHAHTNLCLDRTLEELEEQETRLPYDEDLTSEWLILSSAPKLTITQQPKPKQRESMFSSLTKTLLGEPRKQQKPTSTFQAPGN
jgi:hypothetical protein